MADTLTKVSRFTGLLSGDHESTCFDVTKEDFARLMGRGPTRYDKSFFHHGLYRVYPGRLLSPDDANPVAIYEYEVTVRAVPTTEYARVFKRYANDFRSEQ